MEIKKKEQGITEFNSAFQSAKVSSIVEAEKALSSKWLNGDKVSHILGVSKRTLQNYRDFRQIPFYQMGRKIYYKASDVDEFIEIHHIKAVYQLGY